MNRLLPIAVAGGLVLAVTAFVVGDAETPPGGREQLKHPSPTVRLRAALALAEANDAEAIPVLIDLLAELPREQRRPAEVYLTRLAGEWAPAVNFPTEDEIGRRIRRDAWRAWWHDTEGGTLLALLRKHVPTDEDREKVRQLLTELSDRKYAVREGACQELFSLGRVALPQLRERAKDGNDDATRRLRSLIERIEREPSYRLPGAVLRLLAVRKPLGVVEALLAYQPFAADESQSSEVEQALTFLALRNGKLDSSLLRALNDAQPGVRVAAAEALVRGGGAAGRAAVRRLLAEDTPPVRLRIALALAVAREREGVPVLIDLLTLLPAEMVGQAEDTLYQLAGDTAPNVSLGVQPADKKKCRDAWAAWWKAHGDRVDLARLTTRPLLGFTVICDPGSNRVYEVDRHNKVRWSLDNVPGPVDAWVTPGERVLIAEATNQAVSERDFNGKIVWRKALGRNALSVQRLLNGNVVIATDSQVLEVDHAGKEVYAVNPLPGGVWDAYRSPNGNLVCLMNTGQCLIVDRTGKNLKAFAAKEAGASGSLDVLANGRLLIAQPQPNKVVEYNSEGKKLLDMNAPGITTATGLPNGHILVTSQTEHRVYELDRGGKIVWERKDTGTAFRSRRR